MQFCIKIILVYSILHLTKGQLFFKAITGYGDWYGAETFMPPTRTLPSGCVNLPCIPWLSWKPDMFSSEVEFGGFSGNMDKRIFPFNGTPLTTKKPMEKRRRTRKNHKKIEKSGEIRVRDTVRGGREKAHLWQSLSPISGTSGAFSPADQQQATTDIYDTDRNLPTVPIQNQNASFYTRLNLAIVPVENQNESSGTGLNIPNVSVQNQNADPRTGLNNPTVPVQNQNISQQHPSEQTIQTMPNLPGISGIHSSFQDKVNPQVTVIKPNAADFKLNKTFGRESPLIQVYVIASGSGGAHTSIGEGGYHGTHNGQTNIDTFHHKIKNPENHDEQKVNIDIIMRTAEQLQESRKRNPLLSEQQEWNQNPLTDGISNANKKVDGTLINIPENHSNSMLNSERGEPNKQSEEAASASNHEVIQKILGGTVKHEFQNHWILQR